MQIAAKRSECAPLHSRRRSNGMPHLRILVAEDHPLMVEAVKEALAQSSGFEVVPTTPSGNEVVPVVQRVQPDLVLPDLSLMQHDALDVLRAIRAPGSG